jgi:hypothetical protein
MLTLKIGIQAPPVLNVSRKFVYKITTYNLPNLQIYPLIEGLLESINPKKEDQPESYSANDRLIQLLVKGTLYESCVDYCQAQAVGNQKGNVE